MASIKVKFRPSTVGDRPGSVFYQIIHRRVVRQISTAYRLRNAEWNKALSVVAPDGDPARATALVEICEGIATDRERLAAIVRRLESMCIEYSADDVVAEFIRFTHQYTICNYMTAIISRLRTDGRLRTSETYRAALNSFMRFRGGSDVMLDSVTPTLMDHYQGWLASRGLARNTISFYNRILRAVYNRAVADNAIADRRPFRHVYTGIDRTVKRALTLDALRRIKALDLSHRPKLAYARDMFLLSFYLRGMSFVDMAFLLRSNLAGDTLTYRRRKTGQLLTIAWTPQMQAIVSQYHTADPYLLPIINHGTANPRNAYRNASARINMSLKRVGQYAGVDIPLTLYVARHSWASVAKAKGIPLSVISEGMGHDSENTTRIYLASLETAVIDRANSIIIDAL